MSAKNTRVKEAIIEFLRYRDPCTMDEMLASLSTYDWRDLLSAVGALSQDGRLLLQGPPDSGYQLCLSSSTPITTHSRGMHDPVPFCMGCGFLCDTIDPENGQPPWVDAHRYLRKYGRTWIELDRHEGFCPTCARISACARQGFVFSHP